MTSTMQQTKVVNVKVKYIRPQHDNLKEWMADPDNEYIGRQGIVFVKTDSGKERFPKRASSWANPFKVSKNLSRDEVTERYEAYIRRKIREKPETYQLETLRGKNLGCWCKPEKCHGDTLKKLLDETAPM